MANKVIPTKANLLAAKASLEFANKGYDLLDKKRKVLMKEMMELNRQAKDLQEKIEDSFQKSYTALIEATVTMGSELLDEISFSMATEPDYEIISRSVMGVEIPEVKVNREGLKADYSFHETTTAFDKA
ncbi:MAG: V-type ATP synthase subunit D, partial [Tissierellia bacterium]|nr:V-type ATP synthase subunit D [Tissierellia bacterium]